MLTITDTVDVGRLRFFASDGVQSFQEEYYFDTGMISIGYQPIGSEIFLPRIMSMSRCPRPAATNGSITFPGLVFIRFRVCYPDPRLHFHHAFVHP